MLTAGRRRLSRRVQRKSEKDQPAHAVQRFSGRSERRHSSTHRFARSEKRQIVGILPASRNGGAGRFSQHELRVGPFDALFHIRKLVAQRCHADKREFFRDRFHEFVAHARASASKALASFGRSKSPETSPTLSFTRKRISFDWLTGLQSPDRISFLVKLIATASQLATRRSRKALAGLRRIQRNLSRRPPVVARRGRHGACPFMTGC